MSQFRQPRQTIAQQRAGDTRRSRTKRAADFARSIRLWIPRLQLTLPTADKDDDDGLRSTKARLLSGFGWLGDRAPLPQNLTQKGESGSAGQS